MIIDGDYGTTAVAVRCAGCGCDVGTTYYTLYGKSYCHRCIDNAIRKRRGLYARLTGRG